MDWLSHYFNDQSEFIQMAIGLAVLAVLAFVARYLVATMLQRLLGRLRDHVGNRLTRTLLDQRVLERAARIVPSLVVQLGIGLVPFLPATPMLVIRNVAFALTILHAVRAITMLFSVMVERSLEHDAQHRAMALKSVTQLLAILLYCGAAIVIIATLIGRSPVVVLSSLGALSAVLMLVFKDTILSFTAGILISSNDMLRLGDWITMPQAGADGDVVDISLHTIKVQNFDRTITTIPTWKLVSESYKNWRGMTESGGRRIKRAILIDASTVRFLTPDEIDKLSHIALIRDYLQHKARDVAQTNAQVAQQIGPLGSEPVNQRRLTNLGTLRAYAQAYLEAHPGIHKQMTIMARLMDPSPTGIPLELYCFTNTTAWAAYEGIQGDIFEHLLAFLPELGLRTFQAPAGADMRAFLDSLPHAGPAALPAPHSAEAAGH